MGNTKSKTNLPITLILSPFAISPPELLDLSGRILLNNFCCIDYKTWPENTSKFSDPSDTNKYNIRIKPKECLHLSLPNKFEFFPLSYNYCISKNFVFN